MRCRHSAYESIANVVVGAVISQVVLAFFGLPLSDNLEITTIMIVASFIRGYVVRRIFVRIYDSSLDNARGVYAGQRDRDRPRRADR